MPGSGTPEGGSQAGGTAQEQGSSSPVNLNTATLEELQSLPRVGPVMAQRIIDFRRQVGGFTSVAELDEVSGIGPAMMEALTPLVRV